jgi:lipid II:glycine glycyltransferase (peptidoglycan interpeptide bridge formation enzyme)
MIRMDEDWQDAAAWDEFVLAHPQSRYCQLHGYGQVLTSYGYKHRYIAFLRNRELVGVLPAAEVSSLLYGRRLVSQPFSEYGGILLDQRVSEEETEEVVRALEAHLQERVQGATLELHGNHGLAAMGPLMNGFVAVGHVAVMPLTTDIETLWNKTVRYSVRKAVKQARSYGVTVSFGCDEGILRNEFFPLYLKSMKRLGVPPHRFAYYERSLEAFGDRMLLATSRNAEGASVAALLGFSCGPRVSIINTVSDPAYWNLKANDLLHWAMIEQAAEAGYRCFDFGSVRYQGQSIYKAKWGTEMLPHRNYMIAPRDRRGSAVVINSSSAKMQTMSRLWSAYVPSWVAQHVGPIIRSQLAR